MSYASLLTHRCSIFHLKQKPSGTNYGVPKNGEHYYDVVADLSNVTCYFAPAGKDSITQGEPDAQIFESFNVHFLPTVDVRLNSKVVWEGVEYKLQMPRKIRNHHIEVVARRMDKSL